MPEALWWSGGGGRFLISEVPLYFVLEGEAFFSLNTLFGVPSQGYLAH